MIFRVSVDLALPVALRRTTSSMAPPVNLSSWGFLRPPKSLNSFYHLLSQPTLRLDVSGKQFSFQPTFREIIVRIPLWTQVLRCV